MPYCNIKLVCPNAHYNVRVFIAFAEHSGESFKVSNLRTEKIKVVCESDDVLRSSNSYF